MREFFRGWRRKVGVVTLVMACVFAAGWVRSVAAEDRFIFRYAPFVTALMSRNGDFLCVCHGDRLAVNAHQAHATGWKSYDLEEPAKSRVFPPFDIDWLEKLDADFRWRKFGFDIGSGHKTFDVPGDVVVRISICKFPYWSLVLPLTVLSAYLLLTKPRPAKPSAQQST